MESKTHGEYRFGATSIWAGDDQNRFSMTNKKCTDDFFSTTFRSLASDCTGKYVTIRRTGYGFNPVGAGITRYDVMELRLY